MLTTSPVTRPRRGSEYTRSSSVDLRKQQPGRLGYGSNGGASSLSSSASLISPLDPLPSPWSETPGSLASLASERGAGPSLSRSVTGASIRLNRVPTSVRLAADLIKTQSTPPPPVNSSDSSTSVPTPNPSPAETDKGISGLPARKVALPASASLPPGALNAALSSSPSGSSRWNSVDAASDSSVNSPVSPSATASQQSASSPAAVSPTISAQTSRGSRASTLETMLSRRSSPVAVLSATTAAGASSSAGDGSTTVSKASPSSHLEGVGPSRLRAASEKGGLTMDLAGVSAIGDAASHANLIMQSRQAKVQRWRPRGVGSPVSSKAVCPADEIGKREPSSVDPWWNSRQPSERFIRRRRKFTFLSLATNSQMGSGRWRTRQQGSCRPSSGTAIVRFTPRRRCFSAEVRQCQDGETGLGHWICGKHRVGRLVRRIQSLQSRKDSSRGTSSFRLAGFSTRISYCRLFAPWGRRLFEGPEFFHSDLDSDC